jgi:hypothetical protein
MPARFCGVPPKPSAPTVPHHSIPRAPIAALRRVGMISSAFVSRYSASSSD